MSPRQTARPATEVPVHLVRGSDESLVRDAVTALVDDLVGDGDRSLMVEELGGEDGTVASLIEAAMTPPFLSLRRVVVARELHEFSAQQLAPLAAALANLLPTTALVLVWESGAVPKALLAAVKAAGGAYVDVSPGRTGREQARWLDDRLAASGLHLDRAARDLLAARLGEDLGRLAGTLAALASTYGAGARLGADDVQPYLGDAGGIAPWDLTDAIDRGDVGSALERLHRTLGTGRHPLQLLATLQSHYVRMLRLDGTGVTTAKEAASLLGISEFPAGKTQAQANRLGSAKLARAIGLLAQADLDLKGARDWPDHLVMEVLVARLATLSERTRARRGG